MKKYALTTISFFALILAFIGTVYCNPVKLDDYSSPDDENKIYNDFVFLNFDLLSGNTVNDFVTRFYNECLNREPDPVGLNGWSNGLNNGWVTGAELAEGFILSPEFINRGTSNEEFLHILYQAFFDRQPDINGFNGWLSGLRNGMSRSSVLEGFIYSDEFSRLCSQYGITPYSLDLVEAFVTRFYNECLKRDPDKTGLDGWVNGLKKGWVTGREVAESFIMSPEYISLGTSDEEFLETLYQAFFNRQPDSVGFSGWLLALRNGMSRSAVLEGFISSDEFFNLCTYYGINAVDETPVSSYAIEDAYLQYRNYSDPSKNHYTAWIEVTKDGAPIEDASGIQCRIIDSNGRVLIPTSSTFYTPTDSLYYDCSVTPCASPQNFPDGGFVANFDDIPAGNYRIQIENMNDQSEDNEAEDDCIRIAADSIQKLDRLPKDFNNANSPKAGYTFLVVELRISEIKCGYIFVRSLTDNIVLSDNNSNAYRPYDWYLKKFQFENPNDLTSSKAYINGSILYIAFEIQSQSNLDFIQYTYDYGSTWDNYTSSNRATINIDLSNGSNQSNSSSKNIKATKEITYPGKLVLPCVSVETMDSFYSNAGDLVLSWSNPSGTANWDKVDQLRIVLMAADYTNLAYVRASTEAETIIIPESIINQIKNLGYSDISYWTIQTRANDKNNMNYARGYSSFF